MLISFEPVSGTQGQPGAVSKLIYKENEREFSLMERVASWRVETEFGLKTLLMRIPGPLMKKNFVMQTQMDMERFKEMMENA